MVRMKLKKEEFDPDELDVEYEGPRFERYTGDIPKTGTILTARVTKGWWLLNADDDSQLRIIVIAEQNGGKLAEYNGLPIWEYLTWTPKNARRYQPFLQNFGLTTKDVFNKLDVEEEDDSIGTPVNSIADWEFGSDDALCRVVVKRDFYAEAQEWRARIDWDGWLEYDPDIADPDAAMNTEGGSDDEEPARPTRRGKATAKSGASSRRGAASGRTRREPEPEPDDDEEYDDEDYDDDVDEDMDDDEEEQEAARPARSRQRPAASSRSGRASARPAARSKSDGGRSGRSGSRTAAKSSRGGRGRGSQDEPPF